MGDEAPKAPAFDPQIAYLGKGVLGVAGCNFLLSLINTIISAIATPPANPDGGEPQSPIMGAIMQIILALLICGCGYLGVTQSNKCLLCCYGVMGIIGGIMNLGLACFCCCVVGLLAGLIVAACNDCMSQSSCTCDQDAANGFASMVQLISFLFFGLSFMNFAGAYFGCSLQGKIGPDTKVMLSPPPTGTPTNATPVQG